jgi:type III pantothenate kinase
VRSILAVSLGNTSVRCGLVSDGRVIFANQAPTHDLPGGELLAGLPAEPAPQGLAVASVVPAAEPALEEALSERLGLAPRYLSRDFDAPLRIQAETPAAVGPDRLAAALAAHRRFGAAVVVDFGTAVTVDAVTSDGRFLGGAILAGPDISLGALVSGTAMVRVKGPPEPQAPPGASTRAAVNAGLTHGLAGAVDRLVELTASRLGDDAGLVVTGGGAALLAPLCRSQFQLLPDLVLEGLALAAVENRDHF